jgi:hypothetical protein
MPETRFLVTLIKISKFDTIRKGGSKALSVSYQMQGQDQDGVSIAVTVTGLKEVMEKRFNAWPTNTGEHFFTKMISDPVTIAQVLAAQAAANAGKQPAPKRSHHAQGAKPAAQPGAGATPASGAPAPAGQAPTGTGKSKEGEGSPLDAVSQQVNALAQEEKENAEENEDSEPEAGAEDEELTTGDS